MNGEGNIHGNGSHSELARVDTPEDVVMSYPDLDFGAAEARRIKNTFGYDEITFANRGERVFGRNAQ